MTKGLLIFDLDGTLLDTLADLADTCNYALEQQNLPARPIEEYKIHVGSGARNLIESAMAAAASEQKGHPVSRQELDPQIVERTHADYTRAYAQSWHQKTVIYEGIEELLHLLNRQGYKLAVLSNKPDNFSKLMIEYYFAKDLFALVYGMKEDWPRKPDPALALHLCRQLKVEPKETVLIGDSGSDMTTALRAGFEAWGVLWGFRGEEELRSHGADRIFASVAELISVFAK